MQIFTTLTLSTLLLTLSAANPMSPSPLTAFRTNDCGWPPAPFPAHFRNGPKSVCQNAVFRMPYSPAIGTFHQLPKPPPPGFSDPFSLTRKFFDRSIPPGKRDENCEVLVFLVYGVDTFEGSWKDVRSLAQRIVDECEDGEGKVGGSYKMGERNQLWVQMFQFLEDGVEVGGAGGQGGGGGGGNGTVVDVGLDGQIGNVAR